MANENLVKDTAWKLAIDKAGTAELATSGKYLDRNIQVEVPAGQLDATVVTKSASKKPGTATASISGSILESTVVTDVRPTEGEFLTITPDISTTSGSATITVTANMSAKTNGFVDANSAASKDVTLDVEAVTIIEDTDISYYLPVSTLTDTILTKVDNHIDGVTSEGEAIDTIELTFTIPEGYHKGGTFTHTISEVLKDFSGGDKIATASNLLEGTKAYTQEGLVLIGTMKNFGAFNTSGQISVTADSSNSTVSGTNVTLGDSDTGISVTGFGTITPSADLAKTGYYQASEYIGSALSSTAETKYISAITIPEEKSIDVENNGTIGTLSGEGVINKVEDDLTISEFAEGSTLTIGTTKIIKAEDNGRLPSSSLTVSESGDEVVVTRGWTNSSTSINIDAGAYDIDCDKVDPTITYDINGNSTMAAGISEEATPYAITVGGHIEEGKYGTHTATASVTKTGFLSVGSKSTDAESIGITGVEDTKTMYLKSSSTFQGLSEDETTYDFTATVGYNGKTGVKQSIDVYDGGLNWL